MNSLNRFFQSLVIASRSIDLGPEKVVKEPKTSRLEKNVEEYITLAVPEYMDMKDVNRRIKDIKKMKKEKRLAEKSILTDNKKIRAHHKKTEGSGGMMGLEGIRGKLDHIRTKSIDKKIKKGLIKTKGNVTTGKEELRKQLEEIERKYSELLKKGYAKDKLKAVRDKIIEIKKKL